MNNACEVLDRSPNHHAVIIPTYFETEVFQTQRRGETIGMFRSCELRAPLTTEFATLVRPRL